MKNAGPGNDTGNTIDQAVSVKGPKKKKTEKKRKKQKAETWPKATNMLRMFNIYLLNLQGFLKTRKSS